MSLFKEYFYDLSDQLGGYQPGEDNKRSNTARWIDILHGLGTMPLRNQGMMGGMGGPQVPYVPTILDTYLNRRFGTKTLGSNGVTQYEEEPNESTRRILRDVYGLNY